MNPIHPGDPLYPSHPIVQPINHPTESRLASLARENQTLPLTSNIQNAKNLSPEVMNKTRELALRNLLEQKGSNLSIIPEAGLSALRQIMKRGE